MVKILCHLDLWWKYCVFNFHLEAIVINTKQVVPPVPLVCRSAESARSLLS